MSRDFFTHAGKKVTIGGTKWTANAVVTKNRGNAFEAKYQYWSCDKTWIMIHAELFLNRHQQSWKIGNVTTVRSMNAAVAVAMGETRKKLDNFVDYLERYGDATEKRYAKMIHKKKKIVNVLFPESKKGKL